MKNISFKNALVVIIVLIVAIYFTQVRRQRKENADLQQSSQTEQSKKDDQNTKAASNTDDGLVRNPTNIHYSKHARCRMDCRHIDETEVKEILTNGHINYKKSELNNAACENRYAVEGHTKEGQDLRIIFAPCHDEETVVTVIDLGNEWACDCK